MKMSKNKFSMNDILLWNFFGKKSGLSPERKIDMEALKMEYKDERYREPKGNHKADDLEIDKAMESTRIYKEAKEHILKAQRNQVGYGIDKYPEPLNADTWSIVETIDHIISEGVDELHYLAMLRIKMLDLLDAGNTPTNNGKDFSEQTGRVKHQEDTAYPDMTVRKGKEEPKSANDIRRELKLPILPPYGCEPSGTDCHIKIKGEYYPAKFIEIFQSSNVIGESAMIGGHRGGVVAYPVAVVRFGTSFKQVNISDVIFDEVLK